MIKESGRMQCDKCKQWFDDIDIDPDGDNNGRRLCRQCEYEEYLDNHPDVLTEDDA